MKRLFVVVMTAAAAVALVQGYAVDPGGLRWGSSHAGFQSHFDTADAQRAVAHAVREWQRAFEGILPIGASAAAGGFGTGNGFSELAWEDLPPEVVSLTRVFSRSGRIIEADIAVAREGHDRAVWRLDAILLHEFGHAFGLGHSDSLGVAVSGAMASTPDHLATTLSRDDVSGVIEAYRSDDLQTRTGSAWTTHDVSFPPRNELISFRQQLEKTYRYELQRAAVTSFVDIEGTVVWTQEYLRYRVNGCGDQDAVNRVLAQIDGRGIQPVCANFTGTDVSFPPRNEAFAFRQRLESVYRDTLRRSAVQTYVDVEGDIVWTQEYLLYRVNGCSNAQAIERVLAQVSGDVPAPPCVRATGLPPPGSIVPVLSIGNYISSISSGAVQGSLRLDSRPAASSGPSVAVAATAAFTSNAVNAVSLTAAEPVDTVIVSLGNPETASAIGVNSSYFTVRLPAPTTTIDLRLLLPLRPPDWRFVLEYAVSRGGVVFGRYARQTVDVQPPGGDLQISVTWDTNADLDLHVVEPGGNEIYWGRARSSTGAELTTDSNAACVADNIRAEMVRWPLAGAPPGTYVIRLNYWADCNAPTTTYVVRVVSGNSSQSFTGTFSGPGNGGGEGAGREIARITR